MILKNACLLFVAMLLLLSSSCTLTRKLPLKTPTPVDSLKTFQANDLSMFNGQYDILPVDTNSASLDYSFLYVRKFNARHLPGKNDYLQLTGIRPAKMKATLFIADKKIKSKIINGKRVGSYFTFHSTHLSLRSVFFIYAQQSSRIGISTAGDLLLDNNSGGIAFFLIIPIPLSGAAIDRYNLKFRRHVF